LFKEQDIAKVFFKEDIFTVSRDEEGDRLEILLPFAQKEELDLHQEGRELILSVKNETRRFLLPPELMNREVKSAKYEQEYLKIEFARKLV
ncbi:MAG: ArsA family ATPase, partial [Lachnospiraceae bacterium]|nr:ArsA family ATPase [Lachnospiraceae bacterium]